MATGCQVRSMWTRQCRSGSAADGVGYAGAGESAERGGDMREQILGQEQIPGGDIVCYGGEGTKPEPKTQKPTSAPTSPTPKPASHKVDPADTSKSG